MFIKFIWVLCCLTEQSPFKKGDSAENRKMARTGRKFNMLVFQWLRSENIPFLGAVLFKISFEDSVVLFDAYNSLLIMPTQTQRMETMIPVFVPKIGLPERIWVPHPKTFTDMFLTVMTAPQ